MPRGGFRPGSGRKAGPPENVYRRVCYSLPPETAELLRRMADEHQMAKSAVVDLAIRHLAATPPP